VNEAANTVTFRLAAPDPDFLYKLTLPYAAAVPVGVSRRRVPATGPYMIDSYVPGEHLRLVRNPHFREWSNAAQPDGYVDRIVFELGVEPDRAVTAIERGEADYGIYDVPFAPPGNRLHEILTRYPAQGARESSARSPLLRDEHAHRTIRRHPCP
jgi:peptide/nickel transport system substrate-binding protein